MSLRKFITEWVLKGVPVAVLSVGLWSGSYAFIGSHNDLRDLNRMVDEALTPLEEQQDGRLRILGGIDSMLTRSHQRVLRLNELRDTLSEKEPRSKRVAYWRRLALVADSVALTVARDSARVAAAEVSARAPIDARYAQAILIALGRERRRWEAVSLLSKAAIRRRGEGDAMRAYEAATDEYMIGYVGAVDLLEGVGLEIKRWDKRFDDAKRSFASESRRFRVKVWTSAILFALSLYLLEGMIALALTGRWSPGWKEIVASVRRHREAARPPDALDG